MNLLVIPPDRIADVMHPIELPPAQRTILRITWCPCGYVTSGRADAVVDDTFLAHQQYVHDPACVARIANAEGR